MNEHLQEKRLGLCE